MDYTQQFNFMALFQERYGVVSSFSSETAPISLHNYGGTHDYAGDSTLSADVRFYSIDYFRRLCADLASVIAAEEEEKLRKEIPTLQRAWDDYQLLLKLIRDDA